MEKSKDIVIEEGKAMLFGFIIALLICGFLLWAFNVKAQVMDLKSYQMMSAINTPMVIDIKTMTISQLQAYSADLKTEISNRDALASKYAKLYDSCKNK